jgi:hypothetical protein
MKDQMAVLALARLMYLQYCEQKKFSAHAAPYVPGWATDYASVAVRALGYDEDDLDSLMQDSGLDTVLTK